MSSAQTIQCFCGQNDYVSLKTIPYNDPRFVAKFHSAEIIKCANCGLLRTSPTPILDMPEIYETDSVSSSHEKNIELWKTFSCEIIAKLKPFKSSGKLLDVGCNIGVLVHTAQNAGFEAEGIDLSQSAIETGKALFKSNLRKIRLEEIQGENIYDVIVMNHVIEHIPDLENFSAHIRRLLKVDGIFLSVCPNAESKVVQTLNFLNKRKAGKGSNWFWYGYLPEQHVWQFGPKTLTNILQKCQFEVLKVSAAQNMHWGATESPNLRFKIMKFLWNLYAFIGQGDNLFIWARPIK